MSAPHDPWVNVRTFDVSTYGDCRMERDYYGDITSEQTHQRGECAWVDEVDAARAADAERHQAEIDALRERAEEWHTVADANIDRMKAFAQQIATLRATVDQQQARITELEAALKQLIVEAEDEFCRNPMCGCSNQLALQAARQALETP